MISEQHRRRYAQYFSENQEPVDSPALTWAPYVKDLARDVQAASILDYGCGPYGNLASYTGLDITNYDPAVEQWSALPKPADLVVCVHVLEHVEPEHMDAVIDHLFSLYRKALLLAVSCEHSTILLPDGSPWHCFVQPPEWWQARVLPLGVGMEVAADPKEFSALFVK